MAGEVDTQGLLNRMRSRRHVLQNYFLLWVDENIEESKEDYQNILTQLRSVVREIKLCLTPAQCIQALNDVDDWKALVISSGSLGPDVTLKIHNMACVDAIYVFCDNKARHVHWAGEWTKIQGIFTSMKPIHKALKEATQEYDHNSISMSFVPKMAETTSEDNKNQLPPSFMYTTLFKQIIFEIGDDNSQFMDDLIKYCERTKVPKHERELLKANYNDYTPVWWYTCDIFLYRMLNCGLRTLDMESMTRLGFFIRQLHLQLQDLHRQQANEFIEQFVVYRGQALRTEDFQQLCNTKGGLLSFNCFLSTSKEKKVAMEFVERILGKIDTVVVLFIMTIDPEKVSPEKTPFALIDKYSAMPQEQEILFSMHTVFNFNDIKQSVENEQVWEVHLSLTDDSDPQLLTLTERMAHDLEGSTGWQRMGDLMTVVGDFIQAEGLYSRLLDECTDDDNRVHIYHQLAGSKRFQREYSEAIKLYNKSWEIKKKTLPEDHISFGVTYNDIALTYNDMGDYSKALEYYEKTLKIREIALPSNHLDLSCSYCSIALVYNDMGDYSKALEYNEKSLEIRKIALPPNHNDLSISYHNIGRVYSHLGDYSKALECHKKDVEIAEKILPPNHPELAISYNSIGRVYNDMGDYSKALEYYEKSFEIRKKALSPNDPDLAGTQLSFASCHERMGNYTEALMALQTALIIQQEALPEGDQAFSETYSWFGKVYRSTKDYPSALENFEKCLAIDNKTLPEKHPDIPTDYTNIGDVHRLMGNYNKALQYHERALNIQENIKSSSLDSATTCMNLGETYREMNEYTKAMEYFEKAQQIREEKLPKNHPDLARLYHNMSKVFWATRENSTAVKYVQQAVDIAQEILSANHPHLNEYRIDLENIPMNKCL